MCGGGGEGYGVFLSLLALGIPNLVALSPRYQITQQREPLAEGGAVLIGHGDEEMAVKIERLHLEHDSAKSTHSLSDKYSVIDLNRAGTALMEIVTVSEAATVHDITLPEYAKSWCNLGPGR